MVALTRPADSHSAVRFDQTLLNAAVALIIISLVFLFIERLVGRGRKQRVFRGGWRTDVVYWFVTILLTKPIVRLMLILPLMILLLAEVTTPDLLKMRAYAGVPPRKRQLGFWPAAFCDLHAC